MGVEPSRFVSRAGLKLDHALREFDLDVTGFTCADLGCNVGGFTDCLLQRGAAKVFAIDTGYGVLDWKLRNDPRVVVMERTNALHAKPQAAVDLITIDLAWTPQRHALPAALRWMNLEPGARGRAISLIKPHYELTEPEKQEWLAAGRLDPARADDVFRRVLANVPRLGWRVLASTRSPITGAKSGARGRGNGNVEYLALLAAAGED